jgi:hypothetical protein
MGMNSSEDLVKNFSTLDANMSCDSLRELLGIPNSVQELVVPEGSGVGNQSGVWRKLNPGDRYLEWIYETQDKSLRIWFADIDGDWLPAMATPIPKTPRQA